MNPQTTKHMAWVCRCVWRLKRLYGRGQQLPGGDRGLTWLEYTRLVEQIIAEYRED